MKKFILGLCFGLAIACSTVAFASDSFQAALFQAVFEINGSDVALSKDYKVLNVDGRTYVPIRFVAENLGATIDYDKESQKIYIKNRSLDLTDPDFKGVSVGNLILTKAGNKTKVTGQLRMDGVGSSMNKIGANLSFYNDLSEKIGEISIKGNNFGVVTQTFLSEGSGDFRAYSAVNLHVTDVNGQSIAEAPSILYENTKHKFTLRLPKTWEEAYEVEHILNEASGTEYFNFVDKANKEFGGVVFTIHIWTKKGWIESGPSLVEIGKMYKIGGVGDKVFTFSLPGDVQYDPNDEKLTAEYSSMADHVNKIRTSFKLEKM